MNRRLIASIALGGIMALLAGTAGAADEKKPDATVKLSEGSMALGIGWSWGHGVLSYKGKTYKFKVEGLSVGEVGVTSAEAAGNIYNLKKLEDFEGVYSVASAGASAAGKGATATAVSNQNGVSMALTSKTKGTSLKVAVEGLKVKLEK